MKNSSRKGYMIIIVAAIVTIGVLLLTTAVVNLYEVDEVSATTEVIITRKKIPTLREATTVETATTMQHTMVATTEGFTKEVPKNVEPIPSTTKAVVTTQTTTARCSEASNQTESSGKYKFTYYSAKACNLSPDQEFGYGLTVNHFQIDPVLGCYLYQGKVVLAAATQRLLDNSNYRYREFVHYFEYLDEVIFEINGLRYVGIIVDSCGAAMKPENYGGINILDIMFPTNSAGSTSGVNQKIVQVYY